MQLLHIIAAPLIGGVVGYITNYIAIKMLFRPLKPVMIGTFRIPFTPGIIPKRKDALAETLGYAIVEKFFNANDLEVVFTSESLTNAFADSVVALLSDQKTKLSDISNDAVQAQNLSGRIKDELCIRIQAAVLRADLSHLVAREGILAIQNRFGASVLGRMVNEEMLVPIIEPLAKKLEKYVLEEGRATLLPILDDELKELCAMPVSEITAELFPDPIALHTMICRLYQQFMESNVRPIVESIDVGGMITEKVKLMSGGEVEALVLTVVSRELKYVVLLGAFIGMLIGTVNIIV